MRAIALFVAACSVLLTLACEIGPRSGAGLRLPNGDVVRGKQAFQDLGCNRCHSIAGEARTTVDSPEDVIIVLGGKVPHIETHGELVTSIVNPSHGFPSHYEREDITIEGSSKMINFNETMTVKQLIDLTEYLQSKYSLALNEIYGG